MVEKTLRLYPVESFGIMRQGKLEHDPVKPTSKSQQNQKNIHPYPLLAYTYKRYKHNLNDIAILA